MKNISIFKKPVSFAVVILIATISLFFTACTPVNLSGSASDITNASDPNYSAADDANGAAAGFAASDPDHSAASDAQGQSSITNAAEAMNQYPSIIIAAVTAVIAVLWLRRRKSRA